MNSFAAMTWPFVSPPSGSPSATEERMTLPAFTESYTDHVELRLAEIRARYTFHDTEVVTFLQKHATLLDLVIEAAERLKALFGYSIQLELRRVQDPETGDQELFALVHMPPDIPAEKALEMLETFDETWFLDVQDLTGHRFNVDVVLQ